MVEQRPAHRNQISQGARSQRKREKGERKERERRERERARAKEKERERERERERRETARVSDKTQMLEGGTSCRQKNHTAG